MNHKFVNTSLPHLYKLWDCYFFGILLVFLFVEGRSGFIHMLEIIYNCGLFELLLYILGTLDVAHFEQPLIALDTHHPKDRILVTQMTKPVTSPKCRIKEKEVKFKWNIRNPSFYAFLLYTIHYVSLQAFW